MRKFVFVFLAFSIFLGFNSTAKAQDCNPQLAGPLTLEKMAKNPDEVTGIYSNCRQYFLTLTSQLIDSPDEDHIKAVFATIMAYSSRPYGNSKSLDVKEIYADSSLDCDNYNILAARIYQQINGTTAWRFIGFYGGALGNHSVGFLDGPKPLLLDPTLAIVTSGNFNQLASGKILSFKDWGWRTDDVVSYRIKIKTALTNGTSEPDDLMYWFPSIDHYIRNPRSSAWIGSPGKHRLDENMERRRR